jgi:hypothetical protein
MDSVFAGYTMDSVTYSTVYGLKMDIYQPAGDVATNRPLIVLAHGGSFVTGSRGTDNTITQLCIDFAHKGYVTASIDYRLIPNPGNFLNPDSAATEVFRAVGDGKAAVRYFYEYADSFKIDTNNIFIGGNSAGAVLFDQYAFIDSLNELPHALQLDVVGNAGGFDGNSGNTGYSQGFKALINLAGGVNDTAWIGFCSKPVVSAQGTLDSVVPYTCNNPVVYGFQVPLTLCGLGSMQTNITANTPYSVSMLFPGAGHVPWSTNPTDFYMIDTMITSFLYKELFNLVPDTCVGFPAGINNIYRTANVSLYPNPASNVLNIQSSEFISSISLTDEMGRTISEASDINNLSYQINTSKLSSGIYFVSIYSKSGPVPAVRKVTIE